MTEQPTPSQIKIVKQTWAQLRVLDPGLIGDVFFGKLILDAPGVDKLFSKNWMIGNNAERNEKLMEALSMTVSRLDRAGELKAVIPLLTVMVQTIGIGSLSYNQAVQALLWTLQQGLGSDWNADTRQAWKSCISQVFSMWSFSKDEDNQT